jgi:cytochrome P450
MNTFKNSWLHMSSKLPFVKYRFPWSALLAMTKDPIGFLDRHQKETGPLYRVQAPLKFAVVTDHNHIRHILQHNWRKYSKGSAYEGFRLMLGNGILNSSGKEWKNNRSLIQPSFSKESIRSMSQKMNIAAQNWCKELVPNGPNKSFDAKDELIRFSLDIIADVMLGEKLANKYKPLIFPIIEREYDFVLKRNLSILKVPIWIPTLRHIQFKRSKAELDGYIYDIIKSKRNTPDNTMFSAIVHAKNSQGKGMEDQQLRDEFITLFATGFETAASALIWTLLLLSKEPNYQEKLYNSIKDIDPNDVSSIMTNQWLNGVIKESMRLFTPAWVITRKCEEEDRIGDYKISKNTNILISIHHAHRDPRYWKNPSKFQPERFMNETKDNPSYIPFGIGPRMCIGNHFSITEITLFVFHMIRNFKVSLGVDRDLEIEAKITSLPLGDVWITPEARKQPCL